jgi:hypothetical protein
MTMYVSKRLDDKTISGLSVVLAKLVEKGKLELVAGQYRRVAKQ